MITKDLWHGDIALVELLTGETGAPADVKARLVRLGHMSSSGALTAAGRKRAQVLATMGPDLHRIVGAGDVSAGIKAPGSTSINMTGGGPVTINN